MNIKPFTWTSQTLSIPVYSIFSSPSNRFCELTFPTANSREKEIHRHRETCSGRRRKVCCQSISGETMAERHGSHSEGVKLWGLCPFWQSGTTSSSSAQNIQSQSQIHRNGVELDRRTPSKVTSVAKSFLPTRRRLRLDPASTLYFPYEPGKQVRSAVRIKNRSRSHIAFKFQTTAPKSCYMRPPGGILGPGESIIATVFKFVEQPENKGKQVDQKSKVKFKIMSLKVKAGIDYVPELFDEQKDQVVVEKILRVVFLDAERPSPALEKLKHQLAEAEAAAAVETRIKPPADTGSRVIGEGLVIDEWKERREKYLARQQVEAVDSVR